MADRYLVGTGARNWNNTANWAASSGGAGGASVPTSADNVIFDANSGTGTVTVNAEANMLNLTFTAINAITLANAIYNFNVYGSLSLHTNLTTSFSGTGYLNLKATDSRTITSNGNTSSWNRIYFDGVGGEWTNQDNWNCGSSVIYLTNGTWTTNNKTITAYTLTATQSTPVTFNMGSSDLFFYTWTAYAVNLTLNSGTSNLYLSGSAIYTLSCNRTFYNIFLRGTSQIMTSAFICNNLTVDVGGSNSHSFVTPDQTVRVDGVLTLKGANSTNYRILVSRTNIICNGSIVAENADFYRIVLSGTAAPLDASNIPGGSGDCGGNSNIIFTAPMTLYYKHTSGACNWNDPTKWVTSSGGTEQGRVPLPQDTVYLDENSFTGTSTLTMSVWRLGKNVSFKYVNQSISLICTAVSATYEIYGDCYLLNPLLRRTGGASAQFYLYGRGTNYFEFNGAALNQCSISSIGWYGKYVATSDINFGMAMTYIGNVDFNGFNVVAILLQKTLPGELKLGTGVTTIQNTIGNGILHQDGTINAIGSKVIFNKTGGTNNLLLNVGGVQWNILEFITAESGFIEVRGNNSFNEMILSQNARMKFLAGTTQTVAKLTAIGTSEAPITITSTTTTPFNLVKTGDGKVQADYLNLSYSNASPANIWYAGANSVDGGNNTGWIFGVFTPVLVGALVEAEAMIANLIAEALATPSYVEIEEAEFELIADAFTSFDLTETETFAVEAIADAILQVAFTEEETMEADLMADAFAEVAFTEKEWIGGENGSEGLRAYEKICGVSAFQTVISGDSDIMNNDDCN